MKCHLSFLRIKLSSDNPNARAVLEFLHTQYNLFYSSFLYSIVFLRETDYGFHKRQCWWWEGKETTLRKVLVPIGLRNQEKFNSTVKYTCKSSSEYLQRLPGSWHFQNNYSHSVVTESDFTLASCECAPHTPRYQRGTKGNKVTIRVKHVFISTTRSWLFCFADK